MNHSEKKIILTAKSFFFSFIEILPLGSGSVDPHIFANSDPGTQNVLDPTDHKHWIIYTYLFSWFCVDQKYFMTIWLTFCHLMRIRSQILKSNNFENKKKIYKDRRKSVALARIFLKWLYRLKVLFFKVVPICIFCTNPV